MKSNGRGILCVKRADHKLGKPTCKAETAGQLLSRETSTLGSGEPTGHGVTAVPKLHWTPSTPAALIFSLKPTQGLHTWTINTWHRRALRQGEIYWQEANSTKWRFKWMDLKKQKGGMTIPERKGRIP